jgi:TatD DNase family protein
VKPQSLAAVLETPAPEVPLEEVEPEARPVPGQLEPEAEPTAVDTHCHLFLMEADPAEVVASARLAGVGRMVCVGIDPETSRRSLELAESFRGVFATAGLHPHTASELDDRAGAVIEELLADPMVVGVGETGLDYYRKLSPPEDQQRAFRTHIALSRETGKPLVVHVREAWPDAMEILEQEGADRVVLHCFTGNESTAREAVARGYVLSFAGNVTYPNARFRGAAETLALSSIVAETDSPFLPLQFMRGSDNAPQNVLAVIAFLAELRGLDLPVMVARTTENALRAFSLIH